MPADGSTAIVGAPTRSVVRGAAYVYARKGSEWVLQQELRAPGESEASLFGASIALSRDGNTALIGAPESGEYRGAAWIFKRSGETWTPASTPLVGGAEESEKGQFGTSVALSAEATVALVGAGTDNERAGAAWAFEGSGEAWVPLGSKMTGA